jgi:hypothetical protein
MAMKVEGSEVAASHVECGMLAEVTCVAKKGRRDVLGVKSMHRRIARFLDGG